jgi:hypothetical protein
MHGEVWTGQDSITVQRLDTLRPAVRPHITSTAQRSALVLHGSLDTFEVEPHLDMISMISITMISITTS